VNLCNRVAKKSQSGLETQLAVLLACRVPRKNTRDRAWRGPSHVYNRGRRGRAIFREDSDRDTFIAILSSRLSKAKFRSRDHRRASVILGAEVSAMCLMTTHFHLIVWQHQDEAMRRLMQSVLTGYGRYYNGKYGTQGPLFAGPFRSRRLVGKKDLLWTTAYVHANHPSGPTYRYSTHNAYLDDHERPGWLTTRRSLAAFGDAERYASYMDAHATRAALNERFF
jgi:REP element-mobilizing transposase RayT